MYYNYNNNTYEVKWSGSKKITLSELYIRKNNSQKFEKYTTKEEKDEINEDDEKYYLENIKSDSGIRYMDIKIVGTSISGEKIESDIVMAKVENEELEIVTRDTDGDRIPDGCEIWDLGTDPNNADTDKDGFSDGYEVLILCTNPKEYTKDEDYDGDGTDNLEEVKNNTNPWVNDLKFNQNYKLIDGQKENYNDINTAEFMKNGYYDVSVDMINSDGTTFACIYNKLLKVYRYISTGENEKTWNVYDIDGHLTASVAYKNEKYNVNKYFYENNNLVSIVHNNMQYSMEYDDNNNMKEIAVGEQVLAKIEYNDSNLQKSIEYGNGQKAELVYKEDKVLALKVDGEKTVTFDYNKDNNIASQQDLANQIEYQYTYDRNNNITEIKDTRGFEIKYNHADENKWGEEYQCNGKNQFRQVMQSVQENSEKTVEVNISDNGKIETKYESDGSTREIKNNAGKTVISNITKKTDEKKRICEESRGTRDNI